MASVILLILRAKQAYLFLDMHHWPETPTDLLQRGGKLLTVQGHEDVTQRPLTWAGGCGRGVIIALPSHPDHVADLECDVETNALPSQKAGSTVVDGMATPGQEK